MTDVGNSKEKLEKDGRKLFGKALITLALVLGVHANVNAMNGDGDDVEPENPTPAANKQVPMMPAAITPSAVLASEPFSYVSRFIGGTGAYIDCKTGNCSFSTPTLTDLRILKGLEKANQETIDKYKEIVQEGHDVARALVKSLWEEGGLVRLSFQSIDSNQFIPSQEFFRAYRDYQVKVQELRSHINLLSAFFAGNIEGLPLNDIGPNGTISKAFPATAPAKIEPILNIFRGEIKAINKLVCAQRYWIVFPTKEIMMGSYGRPKDLAVNQTGTQVTDGVQPIKCLNDGEDTEVKLSPLGRKVTADQIETIKKQIIEYRKASGNVTTKVRELYRLRLAHFYQFNKSFGALQSTSKRLWGLCPEFICGSLNRTNDARAVSMDDAMKDLIRDSWVIDSFRAFHGLRMGTFGLNWDERSATDTWSVWNTAPQIIETVTPDPLYLQPNLNALFVSNSVKFQAALNLMYSKAAALKNVDNVTKSVLGESQYGSLVIENGETRGIFDWVNSFTEGNKADNWKSLYLAFRLMASDFYAEKIMAGQTVGSVRDMNDYFRRKYVTNVGKGEQFLKKYITPDFEELLFGVNPNASRTEEEDAMTSNSTIDDNTLPGLIRQLRMELDVWSSNLAQADILELQWHAALDKGDAKQFIRQRKRYDMMYGKGPATRINKQLTK